MKYGMAIAAPIVLFGSVIAAENDRIVANVRSQAHFAERVVMISLVREISLAVRAEQEKCPLAGGTESGALLLGIGAIGSGTTNEANAALLDLLALKLDGAAAEELTCQFWSHGKAIVRRLKAIDAPGIAGRCRSRFEELRVHELRGVTDVSVERVCGTPEEIVRRRDEMIAAASGSVDCGE